MTRYLGTDAFDLGSLGIDRVVKGERSVENAAGDLTAIGHLAERRSIDCRRDFWRHGFDRGKDRHARRAKPDLREQVDGVLYDVALGIEIGKDVDRRVSDEQRVGMRRHIHDENVADPPAVRRPVLLDATSRISSSVCRLPFINSSPSD